MNSLTREKDSASVNLGQIVVYYPDIAIFLESCTACVLLCHLRSLSQYETNPLGVHKTSEEITKETGLSYREQVTARKKLVQLGLITETNRKLQHRMYYRFNEAAFDIWFKQNTNEVTP